LNILLISMCLSMSASFNPSYNFNYGIDPDSEYDYNYCIENDDRQLGYDKGVFDGIQNNYNSLQLNRGKFYNLGYLSGFTRTIL